MMNTLLERTEWYWQHMQDKTEEAYKIAGAARATGKDVSTKVEIPPAADLAARVEGLVGPKGVAEKIRELLKENDRDTMTLRIIDLIVKGTFGKYETEEQLAEQCIRTGLAIITEAVPAAATEGISHTKILDNPDGTRCLSVYYAGPIRSAGGTAAALSVALADYTRRKMGLQEYRPSKEEVERYVEEIGLYHNLVSRLQYNPPEDDIRHIVSNCPVCVSGTPTSELEVSVYKNLQRMETNRIRGGMALVIAEGIAQKAAKLLKYSKKFELGWDWIEAIVKVTKKTGEKREIKPVTKYLSDIVGGRPIFAYPSQTGGLRIRYGRSRNTGLNAKGVNPATMYLTNEFMAIGTQLKLERPGKGCVTVPVSTVEGPTILLDNGDVVKVNTASKAMEVKDRVAEILFLGDILISHGDFLKSNHPLVKPGICEEWWQQICKERGIGVNDAWNVSSEKAVELARQGAPMHPKYTYFYNAVSSDDLLEMARWLSNGRITKMHGIAGEQSRVLEVEVSEEKRTLERIGVPHKLRGGKVIIEEAGPLIETLCLTHINDLSLQEENVLESLSKASGMEIMEKEGTFIGARMGRPEKAKPRKMNPPPNLLFPIGKNGGKTRTLLKAAEKGVISVEAVRLKCPKCGRETMSYYCHDCGVRTERVFTCTKCGKKGKSEKCPYCGEHAIPYAFLPYDLKKAVKDAENRLGERTPEKTKAVEGLINGEKIFEPIEKGILRAKHNVVVFRDGTIRFDATNLPLTHFKPREIGISVEKAREIGYTHDKDGKPLEDPDQVCEMFVQDMIIPAESAEYILSAAQFVDDLLEKFYGLPRYYNAEKPSDLVGHLVIALAPHISVGVLGRIIGFSRARGTYAHPYMHAACRRDCFSPEETLPVYDGKEWKIVQIGPFVESLLCRREPRKTEFGDWVLPVEGYYTLALNPKTREYELKRITAFSKHVPQDHMVEIVLSDNRKIRTTGTHKFPDPSFGRVRAHELEEALVPMKFNIPEKDPESIDLMNARIEGLMVRGAAGILRKWVQENGGFTKASEKIGIPRSTLSDYCYRDSVPAELLKTLGLKAPENTRVGVKKDHVTLPRIIRVDEHLARLLGFYAAEGYARHRDREYQTVFCNKKLKEGVKKELEKALGIQKTWENEYELVVSSRIMYELFTRVLGAGKNAYEKRVPSVLLGARKELVKEFLRAYFAGDGCISRAGNRSPEVSCTSVSKMLLRDIEFLLARFSIATSWYGAERTSKGNGVVASWYSERGRILTTKEYKLRMYSENAKKFVEEVGFWDPDKNAKARKILSEARIKGSKARVVGESKIVRAKEIRITENKELAPSYNLTVEDHHNVITSGITTFQCDGDEDAFMLLLDALLNFSRRYLPSSRGGTMDAAIVLTTKIDPGEVDDQVHEMDIVSEYPLDYYQAACNNLNPSDVNVELVKDRLGTKEQYYGMKYTHDTDRVDEGPVESAYTTLKTMAEKVEKQLELGEKILAVDERDLASRVINFHFMRDMMGNLRAFGQQAVRCVDCNKVYRRTPLAGKCVKCGGRLVLTVSKGGIVKYLEVSKNIAKKYHLSDYLKQRLILIENDVKSFFELEEMEKRAEAKKQKSLAEFV